MTERTPREERENFCTIFFQIFCTIQKNVVPLPPKSIENTTKLVPKSVVNAIKLVSKNVNQLKILTELTNVTTTAAAAEMPNAQQHINPRKRLTANRKKETERGICLGVCISVWLTKNRWSVK
jgi:hypothetical protein